MQINVTKKKNKSLWVKIKGEEVMSDNEKMKPKTERYVLDSALYLLFLRALVLSYFNLIFSPVAFMSVIWFDKFVLSNSDIFFACYLIRNFDFFRMSQLFVNYLLIHYLIDYSWLIFELLCFEIYTNFS